MSWRKVFALVEGPTERTFIQRVVCPHLLRHELELIPIVVTTRRERSGLKSGRGGGPWKNWRNDLRRLLGEHRDPRARFTTVIDLYGLPPTFPGFEELMAIADSRQRAARAEELMAGDIGDPRFIPYVQVHEIEALVFSDLERLAEHIDNADDLRGLKVLAAGIRGVAPEDINDGKETAPSKRLQRSLPSYRKAIHGPDVMADIGLPTLRERCPRFGSWVAALEALQLDSP